MSGIVHPYYSVILAPAIGALVGAGVVDLWAWRSRSVAGGVVLGVAVAITAVLGAVLLSRTPDFVPWLAPVVAVGGSVLAVFLALPAGRVPVRWGAAALGIALVVVLAGPASYGLATMGRAIAGGDPQVGPESAATGFPGGGFPGAGAGFPGGARGGPGGVPGGPGGPGGGLPGDEGGAPASAMIDFLVANRGDARWLVAVPSANLAGPIQLQAGIPVMAMGGFSGADPAPTLEQLQAYVRTGELRFVMPGGRGGFGGFGGPGGPGGPGGSGATSSEIAAWVEEACTPARIGSGSAAGTGVYDCAGAAD